MPTRNINLTEHFDQFVEKQIESGRFANASEVIRAGLRLLEQRTQLEEQRAKLFCELAAEGFREIDQGLGITISSESELREYMDNIGRRASKTKQ